MSHPLPQTIIHPGAWHRYTPLCLCLVSPVSWFYMPHVNIRPCMQLQLSGSRQPSNFSNINCCLLCDIKLVFLRQQFQKYHLEWEMSCYFMKSCPPQVQQRASSATLRRIRFCAVYSLDSMASPRSCTPAV